MHDERLGKNDELLNTEHTASRLKASSGKKKQGTVDAKGQQAYMQVEYQEIKDERKMPNMVQEAHDFSQHRATDSKP